MRHWLLLLLCCLSQGEVYPSVANPPSDSSSATQSAPSAAELGADSFYDPGFDYSRFLGRVSDRNKGSTLFKIATENENIRFLKPGDQVSASIRGNTPLVGPTCHGLVRGVEKNYLILFIADIGSCHDIGDYFRRGTQMEFQSKVLAQRVLEASRFRLSLIARKRDFLKQLSEVNTYLWSFDQIKVKTVSKYDLEILALERDKERELDNLIVEKNQKIRLQEELASQLDKIDGDLVHYRVSRPELLHDRWNKDHDLSHPVGPRPLPIKEKHLKASRGNPF